MLPGVSSKGNEPDPIPDEGKRRWQGCFRVFLQKGTNRTQFPMRGKGAGEDASGCFFKRERTGQSCGRRQLTCAKRARAFQSEKGELCSSASACKGTAQSRLRGLQAKTRQGRHCASSVGRGSSMSQEMVGCVGGCLEAGVACQGDHANAVPYNKVRAAHVGGPAGEFRPFHGNRVFYARRLPL